MANKNPKKENLKPFKKGESGNPNGRPKILPNLEEILIEVLGEEQNNITAMQAIIKALRNKAIRGDVRAAEVLLERAYGKAKQEISAQVIGGMDNITFVFAGKDGKED